MTRALLAASAAVLLLVGAASGADAAERSRVVVLEAPIPPALILPQHEAGLRRAVRELGVEARLVVSPIRTSFSSTVRAVARDSDLVIVGGDFVDAIQATAPSYPETQFVVGDAVDSPQAGWPPNVGALGTRDEEIGFVVGYLAGLAERQRRGADVVGSVGGFKFPGVDRFIAGYQAGAKRASPGIRTLNEYSGDFGDPANCRGVADAMVARGAGVLFNVAGVCGLGTLAAARRAGVWGIGVDQDQSSLGPHILTSAEKRFDVVVYRVIERLVSSRLQTGTVTLLGLREGALGLGRISPNVPRALVRRTLAVQRMIESGEISGIPTTVP